MTDSKALPMMVLALLCAAATGCANEFDYANASQQCRYAMSLARTPADSVIVGNLFDFVNRDGATKCSKILRLAKP